MIGHNWGTEHAERWVWLEGTGFEGAPGAYFDAGAARIKLGPWTTPWVPSGMLVLDGEAHRLGGFGKIRSASIEESPTACAFVLPGKDIVVRGRVSAPQKDFVGWVYADPEGPEHNTVNCSVADLELTVERPGRAGPRAHPRRPAPPTSSGCARPTTASRSSPTRTAESTGAPPGRRRPAPRRRRRSPRRPPPPPGADRLAVDQLAEGEPAVVAAERARRAGRRGSWSRRRSRRGAPRRSAARRRAW